MAAQEYPREVNLGKSGVKTFANSNEFEGYMDSERKAWQGIISRLNLNEHISDRYRSTLNQLDSGEMEHLLYTNALFSKDSAYWEIANSRNNTKEYKDYFIGFASAFNDKYATSVFFDWSKVNTSRYFTYGLLDAVKFFEDSEHKYKIREINSIYEDVKSIQEESTSLSQKFSEHNDNFKSFHDQQKNIFSEIKNSFDTEFESLKIDTKIKLSNLEASLREDEILKISSNYWADKEKSHKVKFNLMSCVCTTYGILAICVIIAGAVWIPTILSGRQDYFLIFIGISIISIILWIGRILTRTLLSEQHLANDASERKVFIQTYLALIKEGSAAPEERILMLSGIFKNISDGIVKDDSSPDLGVAALASKFMSPTK